MAKFCMALLLLTIAQPKILRFSCFQVHFHAHLNTPHHFQKNFKPSLHPEGNSTNQGDILMMGGTKKKNAKGVGSRKHPSISEDCIILIWSQHRIKQWPGCFQAGTGQCQEAVEGGFDRLFEESVGHGMGMGLKEEGNGLGCKLITLETKWGVKKCPFESK